MGAVVSVCGTAGSPGHMNDSEFNTSTDDQQAEKFTEPSGGPTPTPDEEKAAERSADEVDLDDVEEHYRDMTEKGRDVRGEGEV